jgi:hypothetical protein
LTIPSVLHELNLEEEWFLYEVLRTWDEGGNQLSPFLLSIFPLDPIEANGNLESRQVANCLDLAQHRADAFSLILNLLRGVMQAYGRIMECIAWRFGIGIAV